MDSIREYAISIIATALICSTISSLLQNHTFSGIIRMVCGLILTITVVAPLWKMELTFPDPLSSTVISSADAAAEEGRAISQAALEAIIKQETEAYIQNKASDLHAEISVEIGLSQNSPPIPQWAVISGQIAPYQKLQLQEILESELGIAKENLEWTG